MAVKKPFLIKEYREEGWDIYTRTALTSVATGLMERLIQILHFCIKSSSVYTEGIKETKK